MERRSEGLRFGVSSHRAEQAFASFYYNRAAERGQGVAINYKNNSFPDKAAVLDLERGQLVARTGSLKKSWRPGR
jgi:alpha-L-fucosidase